LSFSFKFKSFSYLYDEEQFIVSLKNDVIIVKSLPENLKAGRRRSEFPTFRPKSSASPKYYIEEILPKLKKARVIGLILTDGGCLQVNIFLCGNQFSTKKISRKFLSSYVG
jgi:hypothetical protein